MTKRRPWALLTLLIALTLQATASAQRPGRVASGRPAFLPLVRQAPAAPNDGPGVCLNAAEAQLASLINDYRFFQGHLPLPVSKSLSTVARWHVLDLETNRPDTGADPISGLACNLHSWSNAHPELWTPVCYTGDHAHASGMWNKPAEITDGIYNAYGYEIAYWSSGTATASGALGAWQRSSGHNDVILERGIWAGSGWRAMGIGVHGHYAVVWFGDLYDPQGFIEPCP